MDRDDHALSLTDAIDRTKLTERARQWMESMHWCCLNMADELRGGAKKRPLCIQWAARLRDERGIDMSAERLRKWFDAFHKKGIKALVNRSLCGRTTMKTIPGRVAQMFWSLYLDMKDKASIEAAWRNLMQRFMNGETLAGGITWQKLWMGTHPAAELPRDCPWNFHRPPPGWSLSNFRQLRKPTEVEQALALKGIGAAKAILAAQNGVRIDWSTLRVGECYMIDDHDVDFRCIVAGQIVRLRLIVLREVRTRRHLAYVVRPRLKEEDGTMRSITHRDVMHLLSGWLWSFGLPRDYPAYLHLENSAATVSDVSGEMLARVTGGRLLLDKTSLYKGVVQQAGFKQSGGTPTGKAIIESGFRLFDIELAHIRGATGRNYLHKPEEHEGRLQHTRDLIQRVQALPDHDRAVMGELVKSGDVKLPFPSLWEAHEEIHLAIQRMDARTWHEMEGFLRVTEFRTSADSAVYYPLNKELFPLLSSDSQATIKDFLEAPEAWQNRFLAYGRQRAESSAEAWLRLSRSVPWVKISEASLFELMLDMARTRYNGQGSVRLEIEGRRVEFRGDIDAAPGDELLLRFNADNPAAVWVQDRAGRVLGTMRRDDRVHYHDAEGLRDRAEFKAISLAHAVQNVRTMEMTNPDARKQIDDNANVAALLTAFEDAHARPVPVATIQSESSDALVAVATKAAKKKTAASAEDAWRELQALKRGEG